MSEITRKLLIHIECAFSATSPPPEQDAFLKSPLSSLIMRDILRGRTWQSLSIAEVARCRDIAFMTPQGFSYYLPAFLGLILENPYEADTIREDVIGRLLPSQIHGRNETFEYLQNSLNDPQRSVIKEILLYMLTSEWIWFQADSEFKDAAEKCWSR